MNVFLICLAVLLSLGDRMKPMSETQSPSRHLLLKATYHAVEGSDPEYGQGAIEKQDLAHREIAKMVWLIEVSPPADPGQWQARLNEGVDPAHGSFRLAQPSAEEQRKVDAGEWPLQR